MNFLSTLPNYYRFTLTVIVHVVHVYIYGYIYTRVWRLTPPFSFLRKPMLGGDWLSRIPNPSNSCSMSFLCCKGFRTSRTIKIREHVRATKAKSFDEFYPSTKQCYSSVIDIRISNR